MLMGQDDLDEDSPLMPREIILKKKRIIQVHADDVATLKILAAHLTTTVQDMRAHVSAVATPSTPAHAERPEQQRLVLHFFSASAALQLANIGIVALIRALFADDPWFVGFTILTMTVLQSCHLCFVVVVSLRVVNEAVNQRISPAFIASSFLSTILLFAGLYTLLDTAFPGSFAGDYVPINRSAGILHSYTRFLYFSTSIMTTVGSGDIQPKSWWAVAFASTEMLLSVLYTAVIFVKGLRHFSQHLPASSAKKSPAP